MGEPLSLATLRDRASTSTVPLGFSTIVAAAWSDTMGTRSSDAGLYPSGMTAICIPLQAGRPALSVIDDVPQSTASEPSLDT